MTFRSKSLLLATAASAAGLAALGAAHAQSVKEVVVHPRVLGASGVEARSQTVSFADLDINHDAGARALLQRINGAAKQVCSPEPQGLGDATAYRACTSQAADQAVADVGNSRLTALYHKGRR